EAPVAVGQLSEALVLPYLAVSEAGAGGAVVTLAGPAKALAPDALRARTSYEYAVLAGSGPMSVKLGSLLTPRATKDVVPPGAREMSYVAAPGAAVQVMVTCVSAAVATTLAGPAGAVTALA